MLTDTIPKKNFLKNSESVYILCNKLFAKDLNITPEDIEGKTDYDFFPKDLADKYRQDDKRIMESGITENIIENDTRAKYLLRAEKQVVVHTIKTPLKDEKSVAFGIVGIFWEAAARQ